MKIDCASKYKDIEGKEVLIIQCCNKKFKAIAVMEVRDLELMKYDHIENISKPNDLKICMYHFAKAMSNIFPK